MSAELARTPQTRQERQRDAWGRIATGAGITAAGGAIGQTAAKDLIKAPAKGKELIKPHAWRLLEQGKKGRAAASLGGRGMQIAGLGLAASGAANLQRQRMKTKRPMTPGDVASYTARRAVGVGSPDLESLDRRRKAQSVPLTSKDKLKAEGAKAATFTAGSLAGLLGSQALGFRSIPARVALGTAGGVGMAATTAPYAQRAVERATNRRARMTDTGEIVRKAKALSEEDERKKILSARQMQTGLSVASGGLGVAGLGMLAAPKGAKAVARRMRKPPRAVTSLADKKLPYAATTTAGAGIGGASALNYARLSHRESEKDKRELGLKKSDYAGALSKARLPSKQLGRTLRLRPTRTSRQPAMRQSHIRRTKSGKMVRVRGSVG